MTKFKMTCPICNGVILTTSPRALIWELCPACRHHIWDGYDAMMAEVFSPNAPSAGNFSVHPDS